MCIYILHSATKMANYFYVSCFRNHKALFVYVLTMLIFFFTQVRPKRYVWSSILCLIASLYYIDFILSFNSLSQFGCKNIFNIIITLESDLFLYSEMIYPRIDIIMPSLLEMRVVLTGIWIYVMKHLVFHVGYLVLVY